LDRAADRRTDPEWVGGVLRDPATRVVPLWRDRCLVAGDPPVPVRLTGGAAAGVRSVGGEPVLLGLDAGTGVVAVDLTGLPEADAVALTGAAGTADVRTVFGAVPAAEAAVQAYARGILHWHRQQAYCGACGAETGGRDGGHTRVCGRAGCARVHFPRIEPAVITLVRAPGSPGRCLLARHAGSGPDGFALLAGFVEVGESLEDAVRREVAEEAGVRLSEVRYHASQPWPFPAGLMVAFHATAVSEEVRVDGVELLEARWFTRSEMRRLAAAGHRWGRDDSVDRSLISSWLAAGEGD
jgi:NAD+ diphosphatase